MERDRDSLLKLTDGCKSRSVMAACIGKSLNAWLDRLVLHENNRLQTDNNSSKIKYPQLILCEICEPICCFVGVSFIQVELKQWILNRCNLWNGTDRYHGEN